MDRRAFLTTALAGAAGAAVHAQTPPQISSVPSQRDWNRLDPIQYPDPDIIAREILEEGRSCPNFVFVHAA